jgi:hypothetical protein
VLASEIIHALPGSLEWMVLFDLSTLRRLVADETVEAMFFLPQGLDLDRHSHVVLTSEGTLVALREEPKLLDPRAETVYAAGRTEASLYQRFSDRFDLFPGDDVDCLGFGETPPFPPVLLHLRAENGHGAAKALFAEEPSEQHYELLKAIGVKYLGGSREGPYFVARFWNHLPTHIGSGVLARFSRTSHCNRFFLRHGSIDEQLEKGLIEASTNRVNRAAWQAREAVLELANEAGSGKELALTCQPPPSAEPFVCGDVVPLGFVLGVLNYHTSAASIFSNFEVSKKLMSILHHKRKGSLWPHHAGGRVSATATALVLQGFYDTEGVEALEVFADGGGGYYSHLGTDEGEPEGSGDDERGGQTDYATTCLIRGLRRDAGLDAKTGIEHLGSAFQHRSGRYFANPYVVDWALARALEDGESAQELRDRLADEILDSMNHDWSFGRFDVPLSSAFAILSLAALGRRDRTLLLAQLRLTDFMERDGTFPPGTPFYSTRKHEGGQAIAGTETDGGSHEILLHVDGHKAISTSAAALALLAESSPVTDEESGRISRQLGEAHPRYRCRDHGEYVRKFATSRHVNDGSQRL